MKTTSLKPETLNHLTIVAEQINNANAFNHFIKMINAGTMYYRVQEVLTEKYDVNTKSLDYLLKGSDEECLESMLLIAIRCDELRAD